ncbi:MAG: hypothetical protein DRP01_01285 [Archaeoglobales archaeon]|nr:MAG: hypothetical protein DRP01_01285 [Archaeoglobales archaeon]
MKKISVRRKTAGYIEEIEVETSRRIILSDGSKEVIIEPEEDEEINSIIQDFESLEQSIETKKKPLLQKIKEILPLPRR